MTINREWREAITGVVVLVVGIGWLVNSYLSKGVGEGTGYEVSASFNRVDGIVVGSEVRLAGMPVGTVTDLSLNPDTGRATLNIVVKSGVELTTDTAIKILSVSLLGGKYLELEPGGEETMIPPGGQIIFTQDSVDIVELLDKIVSDSEARRAARRKSEE